jgi:mRNA interferase MazF
VVIAQGDILWVALPRPVGSEPGLTRPAVVVQSDAFNRSQLQTIVVVPLTSNQGRAEIPGNVALPPRDQLKKRSVASVAHVSAIDRTWVRRRLGRVTPGELEAVIAGVLLVLGRFGA